MRVRRRKRRFVCNSIFRVLPVAVLSNEDILNELTAEIENGTISSAKGLRELASSLRMQKGGSAVSYYRIKEWKRFARYESADNSNVGRNGETSYEGENYQNGGVYGEQSRITSLQHNA